MHPRRRTRSLLAVSTVLVLALASGCAKYATPGAGVSIANLSKADPDIAKLMTVQPTLSFPAHVAVARVQASGYSSKTNRCYGSGQYCVVTVRDVEPEVSFEKMERFPQIAGLAVMNRLLLPSHFDSFKDLRAAAAMLKTDVLLIYSFDTVFNIENTDIGPLALISLGFAPNKKARVTSTASAALFDVRTGFVYGAAESTAVEERFATFWSTPDDFDKSRRKTETAAFQKLVGEIEKMWGGVLKAHAAGPRPGG